MSEIRISPGMQFLAVLALLGTLAALLAEMLPEIRRYLKIESM